jgi:hypothetical protein
MLRLQLKQCSRCLLICLAQQLLRLLVERGLGCSVMLQGCGTFDEGYEHLAVLKDM